MNGAVWTFPLAQAAQAPGESLIFGSGFIQVNFRCPRSAHFVAQYDNENLSWQSFSYRFISVVNFRCTRRLRIFLDAHWHLSQAQYDKLTRICAAKHAIVTFISVLTILVAWGNRSVTWTDSIKGHGFGWFNISVLSSLPTWSLKPIPLKNVQNVRHQCHPSSRPFPYPVSVYWWGGHSHPQSWREVSQIPSDYMSITFSCCVLAFVERWIPGLLLVDY
jgi:hypothetical protein